MSSLKQWDIPVQCRCGCGKLVKMRGCYYAPGHNPNTLAQCIRGWDSSIHSPKPKKIWKCVKCGDVVNRKRKYCDKHLLIAKQTRGWTPEQTEKRNKTLREKYGGKIPGAFQKGHKIKPGNSFKAGGVPWNKGKNMPMISMENHPNWKGGISPFHIAIRNLKENSEWYRKVVARDKHVCQLCGAKHGDTKLEAHHREKFSDILNSFLEKHKNLNVLDNREELIALAKKHEPFWDVDNGITLCSKCHKAITFRFDELFPDKTCLCGCD